MNKRIISSLLVLLLVLTAMTGTATVSAQGSPIPSDILEAGAEGSGAVAEWTTEEKYSGDYSVKLYVDDLSDENQYAEIVIPVDFKLSELDPENTYFWVKVAEDDYSPYFIFELALSDGSTTIINTDGFHKGPDAKWFKYKASDTPQWQDAEGSWYNSLDALISAKAWSPDQVRVTAVLVEYSAVELGGDKDATAYVDDITINGATYELEESQSGWHVRDGQSIQDAIDVAASGDTIIVHAGTYEENLDIRKSLTLLGEGPDKTFIIGQGEEWEFQPVINIEKASNVKISGFDVTTDRSVTKPNRRGIMVTGGWKAPSDLTMSNIEISNMVVHDIPYEGIHVEPGGQETIRDVRIINNEVYGCSRGIWIDDRDYTKEERGLYHTGDTEGVVISNNYVHDTIQLPVDSEGNLVSSPNDESFNHWTAGYGIVLNEVTGASIENNLIENNPDTGILLVDSIDTTVTENDILGSGSETGEFNAGILVIGGITGNAIHYNNILDSYEYGVKATEEVTNGPVDATLNWWGTTDPVKIASMVSGNVDYSPFLDAPYPEGEPTFGVKIDLPDFINLENVGSVPVTLNSTAETGSYYITIYDSCGSTPITFTGTLDEYEEITFSVDLTRLCDGTITAMATVTELATGIPTAGKVVESSDTAMKDTVAPEVTNLDAPEFINSDNKNAYPVSGQTEPESTVVVTLTDEGSVTVTAHGKADDSGAFTVEVEASGLNDGQITITAQATDPAGNQGPEAQITKTKDTIAPTVTVDLPDYINTENVDNVEITLTSGEAGNYTITIADEDATDVVTLTGDIGAEIITLNADLSGLDDGAITATAEVTDAAGNTGSDTDTATKDTVAPVTITAVAEDNIINAGEAQSVVITGTAEAGAAVTVTLSDVDPETEDVSGTATADENEHWSVTVDASSLSDGEITVTAEVTDAAGNTGSAQDTATKDTVAPTVTSVSVSDTLISEADVDSTFTITITFSEAMDTTAELTITFDPAVSGLEFPSGSWSEDGTTYTATYTIADVTEEQVGVDITVSGAQDLAGNQQQEYTKEDAFDVDTQAPSIYSVSWNVNGIQPETVRLEDVITVVLEGEPGCTATFSIGDIATDQQMVEDPNNPGTYTGTYTVQKGDDGIWRITVNLTDQAGNTQTQEDGEVTIVTDETPPVIGTPTVEYPIGFESARVGDPVVITVSVTDEETGVQSVTIDATEIGLDESVSMAEETDGIWTVELIVGEVDPGTYNITITATDYADNENSTIVKVSVTASLSAYNIQLDEGWNLISLPLIPENSSIEAVLGEAASDIEVVWSYDAETGEWHMYSPAAPEVSDLTSMVDGKGYWVNASKSTVITVNGVEMPLPPRTPPEYKVVLGWNLIGFKETSRMKANEYLGGIEGKYVRIYAFYDREFHRLDPEDYMIPGLGYWIAVTEEGYIYP